MGNYEQLIAAIEQVIKTNGNNEITGAILQNILKSIVNSIGANATFAGIATLETNPGTPDQNTFYIATQMGTYVNFGNISLNPNQLGILSAGGNGAWNFETINIPIGQNTLYFSGDANGFKRLKEIYLSGLQDGIEYYTEYLRYYPGGGYNAVQCYIAHDEEGQNVRDAVLEISKVDGYYGIAQVTERNSSGINGYVFLNIDNTDTVDTKVIFNNEVVSDLTKSPIIYGYLKGVVPLAQDVPYINREEGKENGISNITSSFNNENYGNTAGYLLYATIKGSEMTEGGYLKEIKFKPSSTTMEFAIGFIDQRDIAVIRETFTLQCTADVVNTISVISKGIYITAGEMLFAVMRDQQSTLYWKATADKTSEPQMLYGQKTIKEIAGSGGAQIALYFNVESFESPFVQKHEIEQIDDNVNAALNLSNIAYDNIAVVTDREGNRYKLYVVDGQVVPHAIQYSNVLVICNSIGINQRIYAQGWCGYRGMASSKYGLDYKSHLEKGLKAKVSSATVSLKNVWNWEADFDSVTPEDLMNGSLTPDIDCIVFRAGENVPQANIPVMADNVVKLLTYCQSQCPNADIYITSMAFQGAEKDKQLLLAATRMSAKYVELEVASNLERLGDYLYGDYTANEGKTWDEEQQVLYKITGSGVANHTNDVGMLKIANSILSSMGYETLSLFKSLTIGQTNEKTCELLDTRWVVGGVVNVRSSGNSLTVLTDGGETVSVTNHNDGMFTFEMPDDNVTISVS